MGRDHTIVARQPGYVRYYRDPARHPDRKYIGIVFNSEDKLPYPPNAPRRRKLGLIAVPIGEGSDNAVVARTIETAEGDTHKSVESQSSNGVNRMDNQRWPWESYSDIFPTTSKAGNIRNLRLRTDGSYRLSNKEIGQSAEHAGVKVTPYKKDRFLAWRKASARKARNALAKSAGRKKGKKGRN